jgi:hypothetical protein
MLLGVFHASLRSGSGAEFALSISSSALRFRDDERAARAYDKRDYTRAGPN